MRKGSFVVAAEAERGRLLRKILSRVAACQPHGGEEGEEEVLILELGVVCHHAKLTSVISNQVCL